MLKLILGTLEQFRALSAELFQSRTKDLIKSLLPFSYLTSMGSNEIFLVVYLNNPLLLQVVHDAHRKHTVSPVLPCCPCCLAAIQPLLVGIHKSAGSCCELPH